MDNIDFINICKKISPKKLLEATYDALSNFQYRSLFKYREDILNYGKYNELQINYMIDSIIESETIRKYLLQNLKSEGELSLDEIFKKFEFPRENIIRDLIILREQGYIEEIIRESGKIIKFKVKEIPTDIKERIFDTISIIHSKDICCQCGLCTSVCPLDGIDLTKEYVYIDEADCIRCGLCYSVCPQSFSFKMEYRFLKNKDSSLKFSENIGHYKEIYSAKSTLNTIRDYKQDGGVVSTLSYYLLKNKLVDAVVNVKHSQEFWKPEVNIMRDIEELEQTIGTIYTHIPLLSILDKTKDLDRIALVALPCKIKAITKATLFPITLPIFNNIKYKIGLFCWQSLTYEKIVEFIEKKFNVNINDIIKMNIKKGRFIIELNSGEVLAIPLKEWFNYGQNFCNYCDDFSTEYADISIGGIGSQIGWSSVIIRTDTGKELFNGALKEGLFEVIGNEEIKSCLRMIERLAEKKREYSKKI